MTRWLWLCLVLACVPAQARPLSLLFDAPPGAQVTVTAGSQTVHGSAGQKLTLALDGERPLHFHVHLDGYRDWDRDVLSSEVQRDPTSYDVPLERDRGAAFPWLVSIPLVAAAAIAWRRRKPASPPPTVSSLDPWLGQTLSGYHLAAVLGRGGMGVVYRGVKGKEQAAIKVCDLAAGSRVVDRFRAEMQTCEKLHHPNIVRVFAWDAAPVPHMAMELIDGVPLRQHMRTPVRRAEVCTILQEMADGLGYAHGLGIMHRDVKPENVLITRDGHVKLVDFGLARAADDPHFTTTGRIAGSPGYLSPEVANQEGASPASDQYSLGLIAWELLAGTNAFSAEDTMALIFQQLIEGPPDLHERCPELPLAACEVVMRMTARQPQTRFPSVQEAIAALRAALIAPTVGPA